MLRRIKTLAPYVVLVAVVFQLAFQWQQVSAAAPHAVLNAPVFPREGLSELSQLMAESVHLLLVGPTGVGKTMAATAAARANTPLDSPDGLVCLLPFYVDLYAIATSTSEATESVHARALRGFAEESRRYDLPLLRKFHDSARIGLWIQAEQAMVSAWRAIAIPLLQSISFLPREHDASLYGILSHLLDKAQTLPRWRSCAGGEGRMHPVLILDEVHVLNETEMDPVRADLLRFLSPQLQLKSTAAITIVLLSSDARAHDILHSWTAGGKLTRRLEVLTVGDLHEDEVLPFLRFLWRRGKRTSPLPHFLVSPGALAAVYERVGGYIPDLLRIRRAKAVEVVVDNSAVASLVAKPDAVLAQHGLEAQHVLTVFQAITSRGLSPRGAVPLASLSPPVPDAQLSAMEAANLVEVRRHAVLGDIDYAVLLKLSRSRDTYVLAPCPLARESMAKALDLLRTRVTEAK